MDSAEWRNSGGGGGHSEVWDVGFSVIWVTTPLPRVLIFATYVVPKKTPRCPRIPS